MIFVTRIFLAFLVLIFCFWVLLEKTEKNKFNKAVNIILGLLFLFTANNGLAAYSDDVNMNYSSSEDTAEYIMRNIDKKDIILVEVESSMIPVAYYLEDNKIISAVRDNSEWEKTANHYSELYPDSDIYVLRNVTKLYDSTLNDSFEKVYLSPECIDMYERYVLYKYKKEN